MSGNRYKNYGRRLQYRSSQGLTVRQYQKRFKYFNKLKGGNPIKRNFSSLNIKRKLVSSKGKFKSLKVERKFATSKGKLTYRSKRGQTVSEFQNRFRGENSKVKKVSKPIKAKRKLVSSKGKFKSLKVERKFATSKGKLTYRSKRGQTVSEYVQSDLKGVSGYDLRKKDYPALGFNFKVTSTLSSAGSSGYGSDSDSFFQSITGIKATAGESVVVNSGVNNRQYKLPTATTYPDLVLTRGLTTRTSNFGDWCHSFLIKDKGSYRVQTRTINVMLLGGNRDDILMTWTFYDCYPKEVEIGAFNAWTRR